MKIVQINKHATFFGGAETVIENLTTLLQEQGHSVAVIGCDSPSKTRLTNAEIVEPFPQGARQMWRVRKQVHKLIAMTQACKPDLIIVHNIYFTFPYAKALKELAKLNVPIVQYGHDYYRLCPQRNRFRNGAQCHLCTEQSQLPVLQHNCLGSMSRSFLGWFDSFRARQAKAYEVPKLVIAPSHYTSKVLSSWGDEVSVAPIYNPLKSTADTQDSSPALGESVLFVGQLSQEKGILLYLEVAQKYPQREFVICGHGPLEEHVKKAAKEHSNITYLGTLSRDEVQVTMQKARCVMVLSLWEEVLGMVALEAMQVGTLVVGAKNGAIPELLSENRGYLVEAGSLDETVAALDELWALSDEEYHRKIESNRAFLKQFTPEVYYKRLCNELARVGVALEGANG